MQDRVASPSAAGFRVGSYFSGDVSGALCVCIQKHRIRAQDQCGSQRDVVARHALFDEHFHDFLREPRQQLLANLG